MPSSTTSRSGSPSRSGATIWDASSSRLPMARRALALFLFAFAGLAHAALSGSIVDAAFVAKASSRGAILWDVRSGDQYRAGHLPGAVSIGHVADALLDEKTQLFLPISTTAPPPR